MSDKRYLFRGFHPDENAKTVITLNGEKIRGEWVYGGICYGNNNGELRICPQYDFSAEVISETVGQWVTTDKNDNDVFEGDKIRHRYYGDGEVAFGEFNFSHCDEYPCAHYGFYAKANLSDRYIADEDGYAIMPSEVGNIELIGNKWEMTE